MLSKTAMTSVALHQRLLAVVNALQAIPQKNWYRAVCFGLSVLLVYTLSQWLWLFIPQTQSAAPAGISAGQLNTKQHTKVDIAQLQSYNLFGATQGGVVEQPVAIVQAKAVDAAPTKLKLKLNGIVQASNPADALAMIVYQGKDEQYAIGDRLPVGRVVLSQIHQDHVIIENAGRYESLWLFDGENRSSSAPTAGPVVNNPASRQDKRDNKDVSSIAKNYRQRLYKNPSSLADALRITPKQVDGVMQGYRISPGRDKQQFDQLGLKANDVVTNINGIELDDPAKAVELYKIMRSAKEATFVIDRDGQSIEMIVSLDDRQAQQ